MDSKKKIAFHTLGCKLNFSETSSISRGFPEQDYQQVSFHDKADVYVINSCTVTQNAEKTCRALIRKAHKTNPEAKIAVVGCFSQVNPAALQEMEGVDLILGNTDKYRLAEILKENAQPGIIGNGKKLAVNEPDTFVAGWSSTDRTRSFFKIQDGCDYFCTYCTIPLARGMSRSNTIAETLKVAHEIAQSQVKEVVLSGVNIGDFGKQHGESLYGFLKKLVLVDGIDRIRISSVEPELLHDEIIELVANEPKLMPHFHIPLQSGNDQILKDMGRHYTKNVFASRVEKIRQLMPHACIAVDIIAGFPTETENLFHQSLQFLEEVDISYLHVFPYSERENTRAMKLSGFVPVPERQGRAKLMQQLSQRKKQAFYTSNQGRRAVVLWEKEKEQGFMYGFTENYLKVKAPYRPEWVNTFMQVQLGEPSDFCFILNDF